MLLVSVSSQAGDEVVPTCVFPHVSRHVLTLFSSSSAALWELGTSLSTSLEVLRPADVSLLRAHQHHTVDVPSCPPVFLFFSFSLILCDGFLKIPKTATATSPICQALRRASSPGHLSRFFLAFFPLQFSVNFLFLLFFFLTRAGWRALSSCQRTGDEDKKKSSHYN